MWELVSFMGGFVVFLILMRILLLIVTNMNTMPEWTAKRFQDRSTQGEFEIRLNALEERLDQIEANVRIES